MGARKPVALVYDGSCGFCIRSLRLLQGFDRNGALRLIDGNDRERLAREFPHLLGADLDNAMFAVADGCTYRGFDAFRRAFWELPRLRPIAAILHLPGVRPVGIRVYDLIARNRKRFGCESDVCTLR